MTKFWKTQAFKELEKEWAEKLKQSGFVDEELNVNGYRILKQSAKFQFYLSSRALLFKETKEQYYELIAYNVHHEEKWPDESDRLIMEKTGEGWTIREISALLRSLGLKKHNRDTIRYIRRRYEHKWGLKVWKPIQMVSRKVK